VPTLNEVAHARGDAECVGSVEVPQIEEMKVPEVEETTTVERGIVLEKIEEEVKPIPA
jgi:hypothetical protein